mgnify:CR=1
MDKKVINRLRDAIDLLESAVQDNDWKLVEEALDDLRDLLDELEES